MHCAWPGPPVCRFRLPSTIAEAVGLDVTTWCGAAWPRVGSAAAQVLATLESDVPVAASEYTRDLIHLLRRRGRRLRHAPRSPHGAGSGCLSPIRPSTPRTSSTGTRGTALLADRGLAPEGYVLFLSRLAHAKGVDDLIAGFAASYRLSRSSLPHVRVSHTVAFVLCSSCSRERQEVGGRRVSGWRMSATIPFKRLILRSRKPDASVSDPALVEATIQLLSATLILSSQPAAWNLLRDAVLEGWQNADWPTTPRARTVGTRLLQPPRSQRAAGNALPAREDSAMKFLVQVICVLLSGRTPRAGVRNGARALNHAEAPGLGLGESKALLRGVQEFVVAEQVAADLELRRKCPALWQTALRAKLKAVSR